MWTELGRPMIRAHTQGRQAQQARHVSLAAACAAALVLVASPASAQLAHDNRLQPPGLPTARTSAAALDVTRDHLERNRIAYGLDKSDLAELVLRDSYRTERTGLSHLYLRQQIRGIDGARASKLRLRSTSE
jgi:hypothetical protein